MKKILLSLVTVLVAMVANAQTTLDCTSAAAWGLTEPAEGEAADIADGSSITQGNFKITVAYGSASTNTRFYNSKGSIDFRAYNGSSFTISTVDGSNFTGIEFTSGNNSQGKLTATGYNGTTWTGTANSVEFTLTGTARISTIKVYTGSDAPKDITNTPETAYTTTEAFALIDAGEGLSTKVYVKGTVTKVQEVSTSYGNATYFISDGTSELEVYRGFDLKGAKFTSEDDIQDGDEVIVYGQLTKYGSTYEFTQGSQLYSINGKTERENTGETYTPVGAGTLANPYTTEDIAKGVYKDGEKVEGVWVKGVILGCVNTRTGKDVSPDEAVASNLALGNADGTNIIPIQLVANSGVRADLNVKDHAENVGKEVWLFGNVEKYCGVGGIKSTSDYSWNGTDTGISGVIYTPQTRNAVYSTSGVRVTNTDALKRGVYIVDGQKKYVK